MRVAFDPALVAPERERLLRRAEYERMVAAGVFDEDERLELLAGRLVTMSPQGAPHADAVAWLGQRLAEALAGRGSVRVQLPFSAGDDSAPEPDLAVVPPGRYRSEHPARALLIVEVVDTSLRRDEELKAAIYEASRVDEYWVVDLAGRRALVHRRDGGGRFGPPAAFGVDDELAPLAFPDVRVSLRDLFGASPAGDEPA